MIQVNQTKMKLGFHDLPKQNKHLKPSTRVYAMHSHTKASSIRVYNFGLDEYKIHEP